MYCIYRITNKINGKTYIGQHKYTNEANPMGKYKGSGKLLHLAYKKYGEENFETEVLYKRIRDKETINAMEIWAIEKYKPEYNIAKGGTGGITWKGKCPWKGRHHTETARRKMSLSSNHDSNKHEFNVYHWNAWVNYNLDIYKHNSRSYCAKPPKKSPFDVWFEQTMRIYNWHAKVGVKSDNGKRLGKLKTTLGKHWYNNGLINVMKYECPEGFKPGYILSDKQIALKMSEEYRNKLRHSHKLPKEGK